MGNETIMGYKEATVIYNQLKTSGITSIALTFAISLSLCFIVIRLIQAYRKAYQSNTGRPDIKDFMESVYPLILYAAVIIGMPFIISAVENTFGEIEQNAFRAVGVAPSNITEALKKELLTFLTEHPTVSIMDGLAVLLDFIGVMILKPTIASIDHYLYTMAVLGRFVYLLLLEIVAPIAIVCLLYEKTEAYFHTWVKHMMVCYLLVPGFMIANVVAEATRSTLFQSMSISTFSLLFILMLKLYLYKVVASKINNLI